MCVSQHAHTDRIVQSIRECEATQTACRVRACCRATAWQRPKFEPALAAGRVVFTSKECSRLSSTTVVGEMIKFHSLRRSGAGAHPAVPRASRPTHRLEWYRKELKRPNASSAPDDQLSKKLRSFLLLDGCFSLRSVLASIWRMRSRVTENCWPTSSSVWSVFMPM